MAVLNLRTPRRFLRGSSGTLTLTVVALACGVALMCALDLVHRAVIRSFIEIVDTMAGRAALQVSVADAGLFAEGVADIIARVPGVRQALPVITATAFTTDGSNVSLTIHGFDVTNPSARAVYQADDSETVVVDPLEFLNQQDSIIATRPFATRHGLSEGSAVLLDTASGRHRFVVRGLIDSRGIAQAFGGNLVLMDLQAAESVFAQPGMINRVDVVIERDADLAAVADRIRAVVPAGLRVETAAQRKADLQAVMRSLQVLLQGVGLIALVAGFLIAFNRLTTVFEDRTRYLGVMRAIGVRRRAVWIELVKESLVLGAVSVGLGVPAGFVLGRALLPLIAATAALNLRTVAPPAEMSLNPTSIAVAGALGIAASLSAASLPAWRAAGISVAEVLRNGVAATPPASYRRQILVCVILAAVAALAIAAQHVTGQASWGLLATITIVVFTGALAQPALRFVERIVFGKLSRWMGPLGRFVTTTLTHNLRRTALAVAMVGIGVGSIVWLGLVAFSFERTAVRVFEEAMRADFVVSSSHIGAGALEMPVADGVATQLQGVRGVGAVVGVRLANWDYAGGPIVLDAFDPDYFRNPSYGQWPLHGARIADAWERVAQGNAVVLSSNFVRNIGARVGDSITLATPNGPLSLVIAGITTDFASPRGTVEMSRELYKRYWNDATVTRFFVETLAGYDMREVRAHLEDSLRTGDHPWRIISSGELVEYWGGQIHRAFASVYLLAGLILAVILFGIVDNLSAGVAERTRELGTLRAVGVRRRPLRRMVVAEALTIAVLGLAFAFLEGLIIAILWVHTTVPYLLGWAIQMSFPVGLMSFVCLATLTSCGVAALIPAARAARLEPAAALRWE